MSESTKIRVVIKLGTKVVMGQDRGLNLDRLKNLIHQMASFKDDFEYILVSSGAVGVGQSMLNLNSPLSLVQKQLCAAVGQAEVIHQYGEIFSAHGLNVAQLLLTSQDFSKRKSYLNVQNVIAGLIQAGVVPVINENDPVSEEELIESKERKSFGDNDKLSALVASKIGADLLVLLTDTDGVYNKNPHKFEDAVQIPLVRDFEEIRDIDAKGVSDFGRGGMSSKIESVRVAYVSGVRSVIANGFQEDVLEKILKSRLERNIETMPGTLFLSSKQLAKRKLWIGYSTGSKGELRVNLGAQQALEQKQASLLAVGIISVEGDFSRGDVVSVLDEKGTEIAKGVVNFTKDEIQKIKGLNSKDYMSEALMSDVVIQRDNLVVYREHN